MIPKDYNPEGRKLTFQQHMKMLNDMKEKETAKQKLPEEERMGVCPECGNSGFLLLVKNRLLYRTCKKCGDTKTY